MADKTGALGTTETKAALFQVASFGVFVVKEYQDDNKLDKGEMLQIAMRSIGLSETILSLGTTWAEIKDLYPIETAQVTKDFIEGFTLEDKNLERKFEVSVNLLLATSAAVAEFRR